MWSVDMGLLGRISRRVISKAKKKGPAQGVRATEVRTSTVAATLTPTNPTEPLSSPQCEVASLKEIRTQVYGVGEPRLIVHWATWCDGCLEEITDLLRLHSNYGERVSFKGICWDSFQGESSESSLLAHVDSFIKSNGILWSSAVVMSEPQSLFDSLDMECHTIPQLWVVNNLGEVTYQENGPLTKEAFNELSDAIDLVLVS
jgi:thiol-disulfide isomerase/thioredoxin